MDNGRTGLRARGRQRAFLVRVLTAMLLLGALVTACTEEERQRMIDAEASPPPTASSTVTPTPGPIELATGTQAAREPAKKARLQVTVVGGSSIEFHNFAGQKYYCGDTSGSGHPVTCELDVLEGSEVDFQRTLGLPREEEAGWRLEGWGADCVGATSQVEVRGGHCRLLMDGSKSVTVTFVRP
jgi:hypothetical protein